MTLQVKVCPGVNYVQLKSYIECSGIEHGPLMRQTGD
jgi:hypothetical protein